MRMPLLVDWSNRLLGPLLVLSSLATGFVPTHSNFRVDTHSPLARDVHSPKSCQPGIQPPTHAGYALANQNQTLELYYAYYEADNASAVAPIILWLQGGPGCASTFGMMYENGPCVVDENSEGFELKDNPGSWTQIAGLIYIDQPYGTGYSVATYPELIPSSVEMESATSLYLALISFFNEHPELSSRPLIIAGESYAGKYAPSIVHFILEAQKMHAVEEATNRPLSHIRRIPSFVPAPNFNLSGMAIGNGLTDPQIQETFHSEVASAFGLVDQAQRKAIEEQQHDLVELIEAKKWEDAFTLRENITQGITTAGGLGTLLDIRRINGYDSNGKVAGYLNQTYVKTAMNATLDVDYSSCSKDVAQAMRSDIMKAVAHLVPDILEAIPCLFYQGQFDGQDGVLSNEAWIHHLDWSGDRKFRKASRHVWSVDGSPAGYWRKTQNLDLVVLRNAGHLAPRDQPVATLSMLRQWLATFNNQTFVL